MPKKILKMNGYTLVELIVVLAMVGVLAAIAVPSFSQLIKQNRLTSTANQLHSVFKFARSEAAKREKKINLVASGSQWSVELGSEVLSVFKPDYDLIIITDGLTNLDISNTGSTTSSKFQITDSDTSTNDYCLYIYISGQSKLVKEATCS
ncbi:GspH/FimT family pseudopilin [uncultured Psychromonas sp.]|uniref:GspH/FimT family pseudopilin n=1 Tax=uncultured Psychromonas sp. TaxID=173974 RepID=UPI00262BC39E|nr:GspH/FimT family pseudopilin [uncultured Psychromonas sp.]